MLRRNGEGGLRHKKKKEAKIQKEIKRRKNKAKK